MNQPTTLNQLLCIDFEVFPSWWCACTTIEGFEVVTSDDNPDRQRRFRIMLRNGYYYGFNAVHYDRLIATAITQQMTNKGVYLVSEAIIHNQPTGLRDMLTNFADIDIGGHRSLKEAQSLCGWDIVESGVPFGTKNLSSEQKQDIIKYCQSDVSSTIRLANIPAVRGTLDAHLILCKEQRLSIMTSTNRITATMLGLRARDIPSNYEYRINHINAVLERLNITDIGICNIYRELARNNKVISEFTRWGNVVCKLGVGGMHGSVPGYNEFSDCWDVDATSMYPNILVNYDLMPRSGGAMSKVKYADLIKQCTTLKQSKEPIDINKRGAYKNVLNSMSGAMKNKYLAQYDFDNNELMCITGQLNIIALCDFLHSRGCNILNVNTDGVIVNNFPERFQNRFEQWNDAQYETSMLNFELKYMGTLYQIDVNSYMTSLGTTRSQFTIKFENNVHGEINAIKYDKAYIHLALQLYAKGELGDVETWLRSLAPSLLVHTRKVKSGNAVFGDTPLSNKVYRYIVDKSGKILTAVNAKSVTKICKKPVSLVLTDLSRVDWSKYDIDYDYYTDIVTAWIDVNIHKRPFVIDEPIHLLNETDKLANWYIEDIINTVEQGYMFLKIFNAYIKSMERYNVNLRSVFTAVADVLNYDNIPKKVKEIIWD